MEYDGIKSQVEQLIKENKNIVLIGSGGNGKSYLVNSIANLLNAKKYYIFHEYNEAVEKLNNYVLCINSMSELSRLKKDSYVLIDMNHLAF